MTSLVFTEFRYYFIIGLSICTLLSKHVMHFTCISLMPSLNNVGIIFVSEMTHSGCGRETYSRSEEEFWAEVRFKRSDSPWSLLATTLYIEILNEEEHLVVYE